MSITPVPVAIVNTNPDLVRRIQIALDEAGFVVFVVHVEEIRKAAANVQSFLTEHDPRVIVYDIAPPYDINYRFLQHLRATTDFKGRQFVLTTVNRRQVERLVGSDETIYEVVGEPEDIGEVVRAVKEASRARPTR